MLSRVLTSQQMERKQTEPSDVSAYKEFADSQAQLISSQSGSRKTEMFLLQKLSVVQPYLEGIFFSLYRICLF